MRLYLDVDGVLLGRGGRLAPHAVGFLDFATTAFEARWLTTHCQGDARRVRRYVVEHSDERDRDQVRALVERVQPTTWSTFKVEALPADEPFVWLDDAPLASEIAWLRQRGWLDRWLHVDTRDEPDDLVRARSLLVQRM